jgi:adenosylhomocysteine nucleosidase
MHSPTLILSALPRELQLLRERLTRGDTTTVRDNAFHTGTIRSRPVVLTAGGMGKVNAAMVATLGIDHFRPATLLFTGVAGGLDETLHIGDIVVADRVVHHDTGTIEPDGLHLYQSGHVPFFNPTDDLGYRPPEQLLAKVRAAIDDLEPAPVLGRTPDVVFGTIATCDQFVHSETERVRLRSMMGAVAVEMEGAAVAQVAEHFGVDHLVVRSLSDLAGRDSEENFARFLDETAANSVRLVLALLPRI